MNYKKEIAKLVGATPLWRLFEMGKRMPRILFYHGVIDAPYSDRRVQANQIPVADFIRHVDFLSRHFRIISMDEFEQGFVNYGKFNGKEIVLTFDDGYRNNYTAAYPILSERKIPFTVFVSTGLVDKADFVPTYYVRSAVLSSCLESLDMETMKKKYLLKDDSARRMALSDLIGFVKTQCEENVRVLIDEIESQLGVANRHELNNQFISERILSWEEVKALSDGGVTIGSHSEKHAILHDRQSDETIKYQLLSSKEKIAALFGECRYFAFPNGDHKSVCDRALQAADRIYDMSFAVNGRSVSRHDPLNFISRICAANEVALLKVQLSMLS